MLSTAILQGLLATSVAALAVEKGQGDGTAQLQESSKSTCDVWRQHHGGAYEINKHMAELEKNNTYKDKPIEIGVHIHSFRSSRQGVRTEPAVYDAYVSMLNRWFNPAKISFVLRDTERFIDAGAVGLFVENRLWPRHRGCGKDLNLYFGSPKLDGEYAEGALAPKNLSDSGEIPDGVFLQETGSAPSSPMVAQLTAAWMGLLHPFEDMCLNDGGLVPSCLNELSRCSSNNPVAFGKKSTPDCKEVRTRCSDKNIMSLGEMSEGFTPGQVRRLHTLYNYFRANANCPPPQYSKPWWESIFDNKRLVAVPVQELSRDAKTLLGRDVPPTGTAPQSDPSPKTSSRVMICQGEYGGDELEECWAPGEEPARTRSEGTAPA
ncbi:hypothetical protein JDV02_000161 [Purpureocillium takamizusanense]|uniref:Uncharacterized protein n=1 Tax=Purpureocillium takamizusanense TaxID=2060973 RepID=A0A9Q8V589_9HYPO|nr:uncharacterized protein JDV02_000161 [Purpureocillium takamizusanense]UNI13413.1 hypothetical protein JDV02_000161 [Purpureocillium takamizusanense]